LDLFDLTGKVASITGSSRGIGRAIAQAYADAGARVVISSRKLPACEEVATAINEKHSEERAVAIAASISDKAALETLVAETRQRFGQIDLLVCNNVLANHWLITMVAPEMIERKEGSIIIVSSIGGLIGSSVIGAYNVSKAADFQLVRNLALEFGPHNVRVNAIAPGVIRTDFSRALWQDPKAEAALQGVTPLGRIGEPSEIAGAAVFLASKAGAYVTGQGIVVDGGTTIRGGL
jgi:NAD(P)-dependent dehydrogenase (short-subunit alcohol dehydrogenase family)